MYTACQGICINVETLLKSFLSIYFIISLSLYFSSTHSAELEYRRTTFHLVSGAKLIIPFSMPDRTDPPAVRSPDLPVYGKQYNHLKT